ncbi:hypothetical protein RRSWK_06115 [Rhodopirellula sp. SWK7]|nr:hypothetical protein RRSWK_06115 [Rhodopirellula sp. SWK7]
MVDAICTVTLFWVSWLQMDGLLPSKLDAGAVAFTCEWMSYALMQVLSGKLKIRWKYEIVPVQLRRVGCLNREKTARWK